MMPKKQFESWMRNQIYMNTDGGACKRLVLRHVTGASRIGNSVLNIEVPTTLEGEEGLSDVWIEETCKQIEDTAQGDADGAGGQNNYQVQSYHGESDKPSARFSLKMHGAVDLDNDDVSSEPANKTGLIAQTMRHLEAVMRTTTIVQANALSTMQRTQARQEQMIEKLIDEKFQNITVVESLLSQKNERDMAQAHAVQKMEMQEKVVDKLMLMAPLALNSFMAKKNNGQKLLPEEASQTEIQIASLADTMTMDQVEKLTGVLTPEQMMTIVNLFQTAKQNQETRLLQKKDGNLK